MKRILYIMIFDSAMVTITSKVWAATDTQRMEAVWMATVYNIDFPSTKNDVNAQKMNS